MAADRPFDELMTSLRQGDPRAAEAVWRRFSQRLVALAAARLPARLRGKADPEDVVQSVFRTFFARHAEDRFAFESWDNLWTLLTVLTVRKCGHRIEHFDAARRDVRREVGPALEADDSEACDQLADPRPTPAEAALLAATIEELLTGLNPDHQAIVRQRLEGLGIGEISRAVGCTERTVRRVLDKVRARLEASAESEESV